MNTKSMSAMLFAVLAVGCTKSASEGCVNYEFETYGGQTVTVCDANICYQHSVSDVLESLVVPKEAEVMAPGKDYVYLQDANYYYVEDATRQLLTIARKDTTARAVLLDEAFLLSYRGQSFTENANGDALVLAYTREGVQAAGSNYAQFELVDEPSCENYLLQKVAQNGGEAESISVSAMSGVRGSAYSYTTVGESDESGLRVVSTLYALPCAGKTMAIEVYRTVGPDDGTEMTIDADFEHLFQSFVVL